MIQIDRNAPEGILPQLVEQLRFQIASGHYQVEAPLPSTRKLAAQLDVSFHTVRKAYQQLEREGLVVARKGRGYQVMERAPTDTAGALEKGAAVLETALQRLIGLGLSADRIEALFEEQRRRLAQPTASQRVVCVGASQELAALSAQQISDFLQTPVEGIACSQAERLRDVDHVFAPFPLLRAALDALPRAEGSGFSVEFPPEQLSQIAHLYPQETLGLITRDADSIAPLMQDLRSATRFTGQVIAASIEQDSRHLLAFIGQTDQIAYLPAARRRVQTLLAGQKKGFPLTPAVTPASLRRLLASVPL